MSYPRTYNAAADMVDRNVTHGRGAKPAFVDAERDADLRRAAGALQPHGQPARHLQSGARVAHRPAAAGHGRFPGGLLGRHQGRRRAGVPEHAADDRAVRLHPRRQPRQGAVHLGAAAARGAADPGPAALPQAHLRGRRRGAAVRAVAARRAAVPSRGIPGRRHLLRRDRVLALLVGLDRHAQGRAPRAFEPDGDGAPHRPAVPRRARGRSRLLRRQAVLRLRPRQRHVVSDVGRRHRRAAAGAADAGGGVPHAQALPADPVLRRADALRGHAGLPAGHARQRLAAPAPVRLGRRGAARRGRQGLPRQVRRRRARRRRLHRDAAPVRVQQPDRR